MLALKFPPRQLLSLALLFCLIATDEAFLQALSRDSRATLCMKAANQVPTLHSASSKSNAMKFTSAAASFLPILAFSNSARAGLFASAEQSSVDVLCGFQKPVFDLLDQLRPGKSQLLKGGIEDSNVVQQYLNIYIVPLQAKMAEVASTLKLEKAADQSRLQILPLLMKGHILELAQAVKELNVENQAKEVAEVQETLLEYLTLVSSKYTITAFVPPRLYTDLEFFGPFGCEYYGKRRVEGTNTCVVVPSVKID